MASSENVVASLQEFIDANNSFTAVAYKEILKHNQGNFLVSPLSAELVLAFTQSGCKNGTAQEIRSVLHLPDDNNKVESAVKNFIPLLKNDEKYTLHSANKLYIKDKFNIKDEFKQLAADVYQSDLENIDFERKVEAAQTMNNWVEKQTNNKIENLFSSTDFDDLTRAVIVNALYFKADWCHKFTGEDTCPQDFYVTMDDVVKVDMMHYFSTYKRHFNYCKRQDLDAQVLELPFEAKDASLIVVLPNEKEGLATLESNIDKVFTTCQFEKELVNISFPKFKMESRIDFKKLLQSLGVRKAFDKEEGDLCGIAGEKGDIIIDTVVQKSCIDVNEEGVEAAAATFALLTVPFCAISREPENFIADHPFIFYIRIKGAIAFAGRVTRPAL